MRQLRDDTHLILDGEVMIPLLMRLRAARISESVTGMD